MKKRLLATLLLAATLFGTFGCAGVRGPLSEEAAAPSENENFIPADRSEMLSAGDAQSGKQINFGAKNEEGAPLYQIVYNIDSSQRVQDQCALLAEDIRDVTGVEIPVKHSAESTDNPYELMIGNVKRVETLEIIDGFSKLGENDFVIRVVDTRVLVYAVNDQALMAAMLFFMEQTVKKDGKAGTYEIAADTNYTYQHKETPDVSIIGADAKKEYFEFKLETGLEMYTYVRVSCTGNHGWRLQTKYREEQEYKNDGASQLLAYSMGEYELGTDDERFYREPFTVNETDSYCELTAPDQSRLVIDKKAFKLNFYSPKNERFPNGKLVNTITNITHYAGGSTLTGLFQDDKEAVFGTGERMNNVNQRGKEIEMFTKDIWSLPNACYMAIPLLCFSGGSGVFVNSYEHMILTLGVLGKEKDKWSVSMTGSSGLDFYVFATEQIEDVLVGYSELSGYAELPEEWTYGMIVCAYGPDLSRAWSKDIPKEKDFGRGEGVYDMIAKMEAYDLPWTGVLVENWGVVYSNVKNEELKELCTYVHSLGKKLICYMRAGYATINMKNFDTSYWLAQVLPDGTRNTRLPATTAEVTNPDFGTGNGGLDYVDITNPDAVEWLFGEWWDHVINDIGVDGCKIDFCELLPENYTLDFYDENIPTAGAHHWYPTAFCTMFYELVSEKPDSGMCYSRGGGIGAQRAPYMWAGDQKRYWDGLGFQLKAVLSSGLSGVPYMSYDMAGYQYGKKEDGYQELEYEAEVFVRGTQFSAFTVCLQTHGKVLRSYQFMGLEMPKFDKNGNVIYARDENGEIILDHLGNPTYEYEDEPRVPEGEYKYVTDIYRAYTKLHEHLTPYITELTEEASATAMPPVRHLVLGWQDDPNVYAIDNQFMLGDAFMIAPILSKLGKNDAVTRSVYLPKLEGGAKWVDLNTGMEYDGGETISVSANIKQLPTFFNSGTTSEIAEELVAGIREIYEYANAIEVPAKKN